MKIGDIRRLPVIARDYGSNLQLAKDGKTVLDARDYWGVLVITDKLCIVNSRIVWKTQYWEIPNDAEIANTLGWWKRRKFEKQRKYLPTAKVIK